VEDSDTYEYVSGTLGKESQLNCGCAKIAELIEMLCRVCRLVWAQWSTNCIYVNWSKSSVASI